MEVWGCCCWCGKWWCWLPLYTLQLSNPSLGVVALELLLAPLAPPPPPKPPPPPFILDRRERVRERGMTGADLGSLFQKGFFNYYGFVYW